MWPFAARENRIETRQTLEELQRLVLGHDAETIVVTPSTALKCTTVHASVRILAESVSQLPLHLYRRNGDARERATDHPLSAVVAHLANPWTTAITFRLQALVDLCLHGNSYAVIVRNSRKQVVELHRVRPEAVSVKRDERTLEPVYEVAQKGAPAKVYSYADVLHLRWISVDGLAGESPVILAKEEIQLALGLQRYAARIAGRGGRPSGFIRTSRPITDAGLEKLRKAFVATVTGKDAADEVPILSDADFVKTAFTAVELELQALSTQTMRRILAVYRIPPPIAGDYEKSTYSNAEHAGRTFLTHSLMPHLKQIEAEIWAKCLTPKERETLYVEHLVDDIVRADIAARFTAYATAVTNGILSPNEVRAMENRPAYSGGDQFRLPMNTESPNAGGADA